MTPFALAAFLPALVLAAAFTPLARRLALAANLLAAVRPDRLHRREQPYGGGLAIAATVALIAAGAWIVGLGSVPAAVADHLPPHVVAHLEARTPLLVRLALGGLLFFVIGLLDDRYNLSAGLKLLLQLVAAAAVVFGFGIKATVWITVPYVADLLSVLWIVAIVNAYNMLDHADGLAAALGAVMLVALAAGQMAMGEWFVPGVALVAAGALFGFLRYNFPPAKLFMGDTGTAFIGYLLAALTMVARYYFPSRGTSPFVVLVPLAILAVPLFDAVCVVVVRLARGRHPMRGDATSHLGHRMLARQVPPWAVVLFAASATVATGAVSVAMYYLRGILLVGMGCLVAAVLMTVLMARLARASPQQDRRPAGPEGVP